MSFNRLNYDTGAYTQNLNESVGPGMYQIFKPPVSCKPCINNDPQIIQNSNGVSFKKNEFMIDVDSELMGITRKNTKNPTKKYIPTCPDTTCTSGEVCGQGVVGSCKNKNDLSRGQRFGDKERIDLQDCGFRTEDTRLSNPPCTLRGTGWNRWEWTCKNPQNRVEQPFDWNISNRIVVKDNHRPCIPTPISDIPVRPTGGSLPCDKVDSTCGSYTGAPSVHWRKCNQIKQY